MLTLLTRGFWKCLNLKNKFADVADVFRGLILKYKPADVADVFRALKIFSKKYCRCCRCFPDLQKKLKNNCQTTRRCCRCFPVLDPPTLMAKTGLFWDSSPLADVCRCFADVFAKHLRVIKPDRIDIYRGGADVADVFRALYGCAGTRTHAHARARG